MNFKNLVIKTKVSKLNLLVHKFNIIYKILVSKNFFIVIRSIDSNNKAVNKVFSHNIPLKKVADISADIYVESISIEFENVEGKIEVKK